MDKYLFIGGSLHGHLRPADPEWDEYQNDANGTKETYIPFTITGPGTPRKTVFFYAEIARSLSGANGTH